MFTKKCKEIKKNGPQTPSPRSTSVPQVHPQPIPDIVVVTKIEISYTTNNRENGKWNEYHVVQMGGRRAWVYI